MSNRLEGSRTRTQAAGWFASVVAGTQPGQCALGAPAACPVGDGETPQLREVGERVDADDQEEREARRVDGAEQLGVRARDDEPNATAEQGDRRAGHDRRDSP